MRVLFYVPVRDIDCAFKLFDRRALSDVDIESVGAMVNTELMVKLGRRGASVVEVGVTPPAAPGGRGARCQPEGDHDGLPRAAPDAQAPGGARRTVAMNGR